MMLIFNDSVSTDSFELFKTFLLGFIFDLTVFSFINIFLIAVIFIKREILIRQFIFIFDFSTIFIAFTQFMFFREFGTNFNFIAVDYLIYSQELLLNIWQSFNVPLILIFVLLFSVALYNLQKYFLKFNFRRIDHKKFLPFIATLILIPIVQSSWRDVVSDNRFNFEIAGNGYYEFTRAFFNNELDYDTFYLTDDKLKTNLTTQYLNFDKLKTNSTTKCLNFDKLKTNSTTQFDYSNPLSVSKPNVILITVESLSYDYIANGLTPYLDSLVDESFSFTRMYATGTRTVRGLEAITLSLPPTPGQSIIRRQNNDNLSSLGHAFKQNGYVTDFIYGGYGYFDNMNDFFEGNGYNILDRTSINSDEIIHETVWGVADEVLFSQVLKSMDNHHLNNEPAFEMVMTTSNHRPFTFPENRIDLPSGSRNSAVKYTDWAIHDFLERSKSHKWFENTIFVIIADHQALAAGKSSLPVHRYHIPCLIYSPNLIQPGKCDKLISQIDLAPTLLSMIGLNHNEKFFGHDIFNSNDERIFISTYQLLGYIKNDTLIILSPNKKSSAYHIDDWSNSTYSVSDIDDKLLDEAITYYQGASEMFKTNQLKVR